MTRIALLAPDTMSAEQKRVHDAIAGSPRGGVRGPLAVWLHRPELASRAQDLGTYCRYGSSLDKRLSELAIIILGRIWNAEFEWQAHKPLALQAGVAASVVEAIRTHAPPPFEKEDEAIVHAFLTALHEEREVSDALYSRAVNTLGEAGVVDLVGIAGYYTLISMTIQAFRVAPQNPDNLELQDTP